MPLADQARITLWSSSNTSPAFSPAAASTDPPFWMAAAAVPLSHSKYRSAARRAFSLTSHITQRDGGIRMRTRRAAAPPAPRRPRPHRTAPPRRSRGRPPLDDPGLASVPRALIARGLHAPGRHPGHRESILEARRHPGAPAGVLAHPLHRDPRPGSPQGRQAPVQQARHTGMTAPRQSERPCRVMRVLPLTGSAMVPFRSSSIFGIVMAL